MAKLIVEEGPSKGKTFELQEDVMFLGRSSKCDIQVADPGVSRTHLKIFRIMNGFFIEDLKSSNGTFLNGEFLTPGEGQQVGSEDTITLGRDTKIRLDELPVGKDFDIGNAVQGRDASSRHSKKQSSGERRSRSLRQFDMVSSVANLLAETVSLDEFMGKMLDVLLESLPRVDRAAVFLCKTDKQDADLFAGKTRPDRDYRAVSYDKRLVRRVLKEGKPVFLADTSFKELRGLSISLDTERIQSAACFPIMARSETRGVLYLDGIKGPHAFREEDLSVLQALTNQTAAALADYQPAWGAFSAGAKDGRFRGSAPARGVQKRGDTTTKPDLLYRRKPAFVSFLPKYFFYFLATYLLVHFSPHLTLWINGSLFSLLKVATPRILLEVNYGMVLAAPFALLGIRKLLWNTMSRYEVDREGVLVLSGTLARKEYRLPLREFDDIYFRQSLMEVPFRAGTLILKSARRGEFGLRGIHNVRKLVELIRSRDKIEQPRKPRYRFRS